MCDSIIILFNFNLHDQIIHFILEKIKPSILNKNNDFKHSYSDILLTDFNNKNKFTYERKYSII